MRKNKIFTRKQLAVLCGFSALFAENALGLNWDINPALSVRGSYTDNIALTPSDQAESDFIVEVIPELAVSGLGRALSLDLNYRAQLLKYMDHTDSDTVRHQLLADGTAMLVEDLFYIDARGSYTQRPEHSGQAYDPDNIGISLGNINVATVTLYPYLKRRFGNTASGQIGYRYRRVEYDNDVGNDQDTKEILASLESGTRFTKLKWGLNYSHRRFEPEDRVRSNFERFVGDIRYPVFKRMYAIGKLGYEQNEYTTQNASDEKEGALWGVGLGWAPSVRTTMEFIAGRRYFGDTKQMMVVHRARRLTLSANYDEDFDSNATLDADAPVFDDQGNPIFPGEGGDLNTEIFLKKTLAAEATYSFPRSSLSGRIFDRKREYTADGTEQDVYGADVYYDWGLGGRTSGRVGVYYRYNSSRVDDKYNDYYGLLSVEHKFAPSLVGIGEYTFLRRDSDNPLGSYKRNRIAATMKFLF